MPVQIKNLTQRPVLIRLNSGQTAHIGPGKEFVCDDVEVKGNPVVKQLEEQNIIYVPDIKSRSVVVPSKVKGKNSPAKKKRPEA